MSSLPPTPEDAPWGSEGRSGPSSNWPAQTPGQHPGGLSGPGGLPGHDAPYGPGYPSAGPQQRVLVRMPQTRPLVVYSVMAVTVLVFVLQFLSPYLWNIQDLPAYLGSKINSAIVAGEYWRLITPVLLHGSILHIAFNMYALFIFGPGLERTYGHLRFLALYLLAGFAGNVFSFIFTPNPSLGSSTAIFGLLAAEGVFLHANRSLLGDRARRELTNIITIGVINLVIGLSPGIDNWGHVGGLIGGGLYAWFSGPILKVEGVYPDYYTQDQREPAAAITAAVGVGLIFTALAGVFIFLRS